MIRNSFIQAAQTGKNEPWRYLLTVLLIGGGFIVGGACLVLVGMLAAGSMDIFALPAHLFLAINLAPFLIVLVGLWLATRLIHGRRLRSLVNPGGRFLWGRFWTSAVLWLLVSLASDGVLSLLQPGNYSFSFDQQKFWPWLLAAGLLLPFQCAAEELFFRGYLTQAMGLAWGFWAAWLAPSFAFGLLHGANPEVGAYGFALTLPIYIGTGLLLGWITLRSESIELALGLHVANNLYSALLVTFPSSVLPAPALIRIQEYNSLATLLAFLVMVPVYLGLLYAVGRGFFREGLFTRPVKTPSG